MRFKIFGIALLALLFVWSPNTEAATIVVLETNQGDIELQLFPDIAPKNMREFHWIG